MKKYVAEFLKRGLMASVGGPIIVAIIYAILGKTGAVNTFTVNEVVMALITSAFLAFIQGGITIVYSVEKLPTLIAAVLHGVVLYIDYIGIYLINGWLKNSKEPIIVFTIIFISTYLIIWAIVYIATKNSVKRLNRSI